MTFKTGSAVPSAVQLGVLLQSLCVRIKYKCRSESILFTFHKPQAAGNKVVNSHIGVLLRSKI